MKDFHKFPHTAHLYWLGDGPLRDDKLLTPEQAREFLAGEVIVEEKVDGANLGLSFSPQGTIQIQNRGSYLNGQLSPQFASLRQWVAQHLGVLQQNLAPGLILFGEWCQAVHSLQYSCLPDWFLGFDVLEAQQGCFWSVARRNALLLELDIAPVRQVAAGHFSQSQLTEMLDQPSAYREGPMEGIYLRRERGHSLVQRAKLVRPEFTQAIEEHWSRRSPAYNKTHHSALARTAA